MPAPLRSDARRNRAAILRAAGEAFSRGRGGVAVQHIARLAGVGPATVYRHFPDRRALAVAVVGEQLAALGRLVAAGAGGGEARDGEADGAGGGEADGGEAGGFRRLLEAVLRAQVTMRPLVLLLREFPVGEQRRHVDRLVAVLEVPWRRSQDARQLRPDVEPGDLVLVLAMLQAVVDQAAAGMVPEAAVHRAIDVLLDGLFGPVGGTVPGTGRPG